MKSNRRYTRRIAGGMLLALAVAACAVAPELLNSERISRKFGNYGLELIENEENIRVTNLYSIETGGRICRSFAVVGLTDSVDDAFAGEHDEIRRGGSIGAVFRDAGWQVHKRHLYIGEMPVGKQATRLSRLMRIKTPAMLAVHIYVFAVARDGHEFDYAMIAEVHHPDYLTIADLWSSYGAEYSGDNNRKDAQSVLALLRSKFRDASYSR